MPTSVRCREHSPSTYRRAAEVCRLTGQVSRTPTLHSLLDPQQHLPLHDEARRLQKAAIGHDLSLHLRMFESLDHNFLYRSTRTRQCLCRRVASTKNHQCLPFRTYCEFSQDVPNCGFMPNTSSLAARS